MPFVVRVFGPLDPARLGLPLFTIALGLVDGFNPCAMWVLLFILSLLVNLRDRARIGFRWLGEGHRRIGGEVAVAAILRAFDHEVRSGEIGGQRALCAEIGDALFDQGAKLGFHGVFG